MMLQMIRQPIAEVPVYVPVRVERVSQLKVVPAAFQLPLQLVDQARDRRTALTTIRHLADPIPLPRQRFLRRLHAQIFGIAPIPAVGVSGWNSVWRDLMSSRKRVRDSFSIRTVSARTARIDCLENEVARGLGADGFGGVGAVGCKFLFRYWHTTALCGRESGLPAYVIGFVG